MSNSLVKHRRAATANSGWPTLLPGEIAVNAFNGELAVGDADGAPVPLMAVVSYRTSGIYQFNQLAAYQGQVYRCKADNVSGAFDPINWEQITGTTFNLGVFNPTPVITANYVAKPNDWCRVNTLQQEIFITLPASPQDGVSVRISDVGHNFGVNICTVIGNGNPINGQAVDLVLRQQRDAVLLYTAGLGWGGYP